MTTWEIIGGTIGGLLIGLVFHEWRAARRRKDRRGQRWGSSHELSDVYEGEGGAPMIDRYEMQGRKIVAREIFIHHGDDGWRTYPGLLKVEDCSWLDLALQNWRLLGEPAGAPLQKLPHKLQLVEPGEEPEK